MCQSLKARDENKWMMLNMSIMMIADMDFTIFYMVPRTDWGQVRVIFFFFYSSWGCTSHNIRSVNYLLISAMLYDRSITEVVEFLFFHSAIWRKTKLGEIKSTPRIWREHPALTNCADFQLWTSFNKCWSQNFLFRNTEMRMLPSWDENEIDEELKVWQRRM